MYYTYMLRCEDNSIYTGITTDVERRMNEHFGRDEKCAKYTLKHHAKKLECVWESENRVLASKLEYHIKKLPKAQKEKIITNKSLDNIFNEKIDVNNYKLVEEECNYGSNTCK